MKLQYRLSSAEVSRDLPVAPNATALTLLERKERLSTFALFVPALFLVGAFLVIPVGWLFYLSFVSDGHFSLAHYARMLGYSSYATILLTTVEVSIIVTVICVVVGFPAAYLVAQLPKWPALICLSLIVIPFWTSLLVRT